MTNEAYYIPTGEKQKADWDAYRKAWGDYATAANVLAGKIGATKYSLGFAGGLVAAVFEPKSLTADAVIHPAFSARSNKYGAHTLMSRGRSQAQKDAIAEMEAENEKLRALRPDANEVGEAHGFIWQVAFKPADGSEFPYGQRAVNSRFNLVDPVFFGVDSEIIIIAGDAQARIDELMAEKHEKPLVFEPSKFDTPEGYTRITKARYEFMKAEYKLKKEEEKANG